MAIRFAGIYIGVRIAMGAVEKLANGTDETRKKNMYNKKVFHPQDIDLSYFQWDEYLFERGNRSTYAVAIQVTVQNIGKLAIEFESQIFQGGPGKIYFVATVGSPDSAVGLTFHLNDWLVILLDDEHREFRCLPDEVFVHTFIKTVEDVDPVDHDRPKTLNELAPLNRHGSLQDTFDQVRQDMGMPAILSANANNNRQTVVVKGQEQLGIGAVRSVDSSGRAEVYFEHRESTEYFDVESLKPYPFE